MVIVIMGVSGSGKTTVGKLLAEQLGACFVDADDMHPARNIAKMQAGEPLTNPDREPWLRALRARIDQWLTKDESAVIACSALTGNNRELLGVSREGVVLAWLTGPRELIAARMRTRQHFMPPALLDSQFATLEPPDDAIELDIRQSPAALVAAIKHHLARPAS